MIVKDAQKTVVSIVKFVKDWYSAFSGRVLTYGCTPNTFCFGNTPRDRFSGEKAASPAAFFLLLVLTDKIRYNILWSMQGTGGFVCI